jgi:hypothetical protein
MEYVGRRPCQIAIGSHMEDARTVAKATDRFERRREKRNHALSEPMVELKFPGLPTYQLKLKEISPRGAGIIVRPDSKLLGLISVGQKLKLRLLSPVSFEMLSGDFGATIEHISELREGAYKGHIVVGVSLNGISGSGG